MIERVRKVDVFTPGRPAGQLRGQAEGITNFVERDFHITRMLVRALETSGCQVVVHGPSGSGKTTLLQNKLEQLYPNHIVTRCTGGSSFQTVVLDGFDRLNPFYQTQREMEGGRSRSLGAEYGLIKAEMSSSVSETTQMSRVLPKQLTEQNLADFIGETGRCWVIDDFHKVPANEKQRLAQMFKVFSDAASDHPDLKIIVVGVEDSAREIIKHEGDLENRLIELLIPPMSAAELGAIMTKGESLLNIQFDRGVRASIVQYASGLASICHRLCLNACEAANVECTMDSKTYIDGRHLDTALSECISQMSGTMGTKLKPVLADPVCRAILKLVSEQPWQGVEERSLYASIQKSVPRGERDEMRRSLDRLSAGAEFLLVESAGRIRFADTLSQVYCRLLLDDRFGAIGQMSDFDRALLRSGGR